MAERDDDSGRQWDRRSHFVVCLLTIRGRVGKWINPAAKFVQGYKIEVLAVPTRTVVFSPKGMLTWIRISRVLHRSAAVCLTFVLFFASLAPGAAEVLNKRATGMACCRTTRGKGCCHKNHTSSGPAFSAKPCSSDCCDLGPGVSARGATVPKGRATGIPAMHSAGISSTAEVSRFSVVSSYNLRQRPPPSNLFI